MATGHNPIGARAYTSNSTPTPDLDREVHRQRLTTPAIVEKAQVECRGFKWYVEKFEETAKRHGEEYAVLVKEFKESGAWRDKYDDWSDACEHVLGISKRWANKMIEKLSKSTIVGTTVPTSNSQATPNQPQTDQSHNENRTTSVPQNSTTPATQTASTGATAPTLSPEQAKPPKDKSGCFIPEKLLELYERRKELTKPMHFIAQVRTALEELQTEKDVLYMSIVHNGIVQTTAKCAESLYHALRECQPEIVCPECDGGQNSKSIRCTECGGSGMISEEKYNRAWVKSTRPERLAIVKGRMANL